MSAPNPSVAVDVTFGHLMETYQRAWETRDAELAAGLFTEDATYQENPFSASLVGRDAIRRYWEEATASQRDIQFRWQPVCRAENLHVVQWEAELTRIASGQRVALRGVMLIELHGERICHFREYWHRTEKWKLPETSPAR